MDFDGFTHLTFDCYGTLVDWETGILTALEPVLERHGAKARPDRLLRLFARNEAEEESREYQSYRSVLRNVMAGIAAEVGFPPNDRDLDALPDSVGDWPLFDDTRDALQRLGGRYRLAVLSNVDDDLFARTREAIGYDFADVITAEQVQSYKPGHAHFKKALERLGAERHQVLHVAQSLFHDHVPAKALGFTTVWVNRESRRKGSGATPPAEARPDLEVPDLASLVAEMGL
ncbi:MAG: haloacid dehalogenase type II [Thermoanaerobaculia bacterium]|nr:haloacid dehalogenase type II [Thermoanaerobaculia bacterium]